MYVMIVSQDKRGIRFTVGWKIFHDSPENGESTSSSQNGRCRKDQKQDKLEIPEAGCCPFGGHKDAAGALSAEERSPRNDWT